jgi:hypothetical protein
MRTFLDHLGLSGLLEMKMSKAKTVVADAVGAVVNGDEVQSALGWSELQVSLIQGGAELLCDAAGDQAKGLDQIKNAFAEAFKAGVLTFDLWEDGRKRYEAAFILRCDNQAIKPINPTNSANSSWNQTVVPYLKVCQLIKPKSADAGSVERAKRREAEKAKAVAVANGRSVEELKEAQLALYRTATPEAIAEAKTLDKSIEVIEKDTKKESEGRLSILKKSLRELVSEVCKTDNELVLASAIIAMKEFVPAKS